MLTNVHIVVHAGIITATAAFAVNFGVENLSGFKFAVTLRMVDSDWLFGSWLVYSCINCALVGASTALTVYVAPAAAGSGIAEVKVSITAVISLVTSSQHDKTAK